MLQFTSIGPGLDPDLEHSCYNYTYNYGLLYAIDAGALTKKLVAMKEHLEGKLNKESDGGKGSALPAISEAQRRKEREIVSKEVSGHMPD